MRARVGLRPGLRKNKLISQLWFEPMFGYGKHPYHVNADGEWPEPHCVHFHSVKILISPVGFKGNLSLLFLFSRGLKQTEVHHCSFEKRDVSRGSASPFLRFSEIGPFKKGTPDARSKISASPDLS